jgi:peptidoglycan lytic transglycosylase G
VSGGYGPGGYPGQGYGEPDYDDPGYARQRRPGRGQRPRDGQDRPGDRGYQEYGAPGYDSQGYDPQGYGRPDERSGGYPSQAQGRGGYGYQGTGPQPGQYGTGGRPQYGQRDYDQRGTGPRGMAGGYDQRASADYNRAGYNQGGDREHGQDDGSFLPGFGRGDQGRPGGPDGYDYGDQRAPRGGRPDARGGWDAGDRGAGPRDRDGGRRDRDNRGADPGDRAAWANGRPPPRRKVTRWFPRILVLVIVFAVLIGGGLGALSVYHKYEARYHPADYAGAGTGEVTFQVDSGDTAFSVAPRLLQLGIIASSRAFTNAAENSPALTGTGGSSNGLEAGFYQLHYHMQASLAYAALVNPKNRVQTTVTIPEGKRAVDVIAIIAKQTKIPLKDFQQVLAHPSQLGLPSYAGGKAEGYLFPATYAIEPHETALQILQAMVQRFNIEAQAINLTVAAKAAGLTPAALVIEASLLQAEGGSVADYPKIAEVINNRLRIGMHLQFDSTVLYGLGKYAVSATIKQTKTPGPYNTYLNPGLPVGPIANPGNAAIQGVLHPDHGNWLYFLTVPGGKSQFSATPLKGQ